MRCTGFHAGPPFGDDGKEPSPAALCRARPGGSSTCGSGPTALDGPYRTSRIGDTLRPMSARAFGSRRSWVLAGVGLACTAALAVAVAQTGDEPAERPVLHERVEGLADFRWDPVDPESVAAARVTPAQPGDPLLAAPGPAELPPATADLPESVPIPPRPAGSVSDVPPPQFHPDLDTNSRSIPGDPNPAGILWSPSPGPYLRQQVFDLVRDDGILDAPPHSGALDPLPAPIGQVDTERFIGRAALDVAGDMPIQLPSPAPEFRAAIVGGARDGDRLATDRAGNLFFVPGRIRGERELVISLEADARVFGGAIDGGTRLDSVPAHSRSAFPDGFRGSAQRVLETIGVSRDLTVEAALRLLATWFRSFQPGPPPAGAPGTDYELLALGRVGLCRHRAYAFVLTAQALGLAARMPVSRLHAWVEVLVPVVDAGVTQWLWRRIDLGGAYGEQDEAVAEIPAHVPDLPDPLPWPRGAHPTPAAPLPGASGPNAGNGTSTVTEAADAGAGGEEPSAAGADASSSPVAVIGDAGSPVGPGEAGRGNSSPPGPPTMPPQPPGTVAVAPPRWPGPPTPPVTGPPPPASPVPLSAPSATLDRYPFDATRGDAVEVAGRVPDTLLGTPLVHVVLERPGMPPHDLGSLAVTSAGSFAGRLTVPSDIVPGDYVLRAYASQP
jgi:hypothetical protein